MSEDNVEVLRKLFAAWARGDYATTYAFDPQVEFARIASDDPGTDGEWRGLDEMWAAILDWLRAWEDVRFEAERFIELGDRVLAFTRQTGRGKRSGVPLNHKQGELFTLRDGKIVRWESYWDRTEAMKAAGLEE